MRKDGFTLIELLGIILVLGFLALITTPIIMNTIEQSKKASVLRSAEHIIKTATLGYTTNDNFTTEKKDILTLDFDGEKPELGYIQFNQNEKVQFYMVQNGYCVAKRYDSELVAVKSKDIDICDWYTSPKTIRENTTNSILTLNNIEEGNLLNYRIYGNSYQETRTSSNNLLKTYGREEGEPSDTSSASVARKYNFNEYIVGLGYNNKYNPSSIVNLSITEDTISFVSGGATWGIGFPLEIKPNTTYIVSPSHSETDNTYYNQVYYDEDGNYLSSGNSSSKFTTPENCAYMVFVIRPRKSGQLVSVKNIQLEEGSVATEYKPYGIMPSPEVPSDIETLGALVTDEDDENYGKYKIDIKTSGKNLFDINNTIVLPRNKKFIKVGDLLTTQGQYGHSTSNVIPLKANTTYTFSGQAVGDSFRVYYLQSNDGWKSWDYQSQILYEENSQINWTATTGDDSYEYGLGIISTNAYDSTHGIKNFQLEEGNKASEYEPYQGNTYSIYLDQSLRCVGDVCDYIDFESQTIVRYIEEIILTGNESGWSTATWNGGFGTALAKALPYNMYRNTGLSSHDIINTTGFKNPGIVLGNNNKNIYWVGVLDVLSLTDITEFKSWLKEQNNNGIPVVVQYQLEKPEYEPISLPKIEVFDSTNNILVTDGNLSASKIEVIALKK